VRRVTDAPGADHRAALHRANEAFSAPPAPAALAPWWRRNLRWLALMVLADLLVGTLLWRWLRDEASTPQRAVEQAVQLVADKDYAGLRGALCAPDRVRFTEGELAQAGRSAHLVLHGVDGFDVERVVVVPDVSLGPASLPARRVEGKVVALLGDPSRAWVTVVKEPTAWKVCLSAGGYGLDVMGVDVPAADQLLP